MLDAALLEVVVLDVAEDDVEDEFDEAVAAEDAALLEGADSEDGLDGTVTLLLLEEACGAEGVATGVGLSA